MLITSSPNLYLQLANDERLVYRGEGNSSLVIALKLERKVIRLLKADAKQLKNVETENIYSMLMSHIAFNVNVIPAIINTNFYTYPQLIKLNESQIETINQLVRDKRPSFRLDKTISNSDTYALLLPDYCCLPKSLRQFSSAGPVISVEIKPKQGFLPDAGLLIDELKIKSQVCRYCLAQFHKLKKRSISRISNYCPLDLFSGCPKRMSTAISSLIEAPQNNFRVFRDIHLAYADETNTSLTQVLHDFIVTTDAKVDKIDVFSKLLIDALRLRLAPNSKSKNTTQLTQYCEMHNTDHKCLCNDSDHLQPSGSVLDVILEAQKLDTIDSSIACDMFDYITLMAINNEYIIDKLNCSSVPASFDCEKQLIGETKLDYYSRKVWQFLVSLTAKDCSIMISMQRLVDEDASDVPLNHLIYDKITGEKYLVSVSVTDLDQKSPHKIKRTLSNDRRMVRAFYQHL